MRYLLKNSIKKTYKNVGRYISIILIIALGVSVFMGLYESTAGMLYTTDKYYDDNNLMDYKIISTYGLTKGDVQALKELDYIKKVVPSYSVDILHKGDSIRIHALEKEMNNVVLTKGRMPKDQTECVGDFDYFKIGDQVKYNNEYIKTSKCKVVGLITSPLYIREDKGISNIGNGKLTSFVFLNKENFDMDYYTEIYLEAENTKELSSYYEEYEYELENSKIELEKLKPIRETIRYEEILKEASTKIKDAEIKLEIEINDAFKTLDKAKKELDDGSKKISEEETKAFNKIKSEENKLIENKEQILTTLELLNIKESELEPYISNLNKEVNNLKEYLSTLDKSNPEYSIINENIKLIEKNISELETLSVNLNLINEGLTEIEKQKINVKEKFDEEKLKIYEGIIEYEDGLNKTKEEELEALNKIEEEKEKLETLEKPKWYLLDRTDNSGYSSYKDDIVKVDSIAKVLPIFFILVVTLMVSNTLSRLVEEERTEMGILLSNGYSKTHIIFSYLFYVLTAGLIGLLIGLTIGYVLIPKIIYSVFLARYYVPRLITIVSPLPFSLVITLTITLMVLVTIVSSLKELKHAPASLLRPKSPKVGKKIFLERLTWFWSKLSFLNQTTARNLFRYKKRIIMTTIGVAGCMALLIAGMGINDSINTISKLQYENIIKYDAMYILKDEDYTLNPKLTKFFKDNEIVNPELIKQNAFKFHFKDKTEEVYLTVPKNINNFNNYVTLTSVISNKKISIPNKGAVVTKQFADWLNIQKGDLFSIRNSDNELFYMYVEDIVTNYVSHYIYISEDYYKSVFGENAKYNIVIANGELSNNIDLNKHDILTANYIKDVVKTFNSFIHGLNQIIVMIVVFAAFLAFIVLYNLTIINISERKREIATFKVLGFYNREISIYVFRETFFLTVLGILGGLLLGNVLHKYIMTTAETDNIMFLKTIRPMSFILSAAITLVFALIVQFIIHKTLKEIDMIESLKITE